MDTSLGLPKSAFTKIERDEDEVERDAELDRERGAAGQLERRRRDARRRTQLLRPGAERPEKEQSRQPCLSHRSGSGRQRDVGYDNKMMGDVGQK